MDTKLLESLLADVPPSGLFRADYTDTDDQCWYIVPGSHEGTIAKVAAGYGKLAELFSLAPDLLRDFIDQLRKVEAAEKLAAAAQDYYDHSSPLANLEHHRSFRAALAAWEAAR